MPHSTRFDLCFVCVVFILSIRVPAVDARRVLTLNQTLAYFLNGTTLYYFVNASACDHQDPSPIFPVIPYSSYGGQLSFGYAFVQTTNWFISHSTFQLVNDSWLNTTDPVRRMTKMDLNSGGYASINLNDFDSAMNQLAFQDYWCNVSTGQIIFTAPDQPGTKLHTYEQVVAALRTGESLSFAADLAKCKSAEEKNADHTTHHTTHHTTQANTHHTSTATEPPLHPTAQPTPTKHDHITPDIVGRGLLPWPSTVKPRKLNNPKDKNPRRRQRDVLKHPLRRLVSRRREEQSQGGEISKSHRRTRAEPALAGNATWAGVIKDFSFDSRGGVHVLAVQPIISEDEELEVVITPPNSVVVTLSSNFRDPRPPRLDWQYDCTLADGGGFTVIQW